MEGWSSRWCNRPISAQSVQRKGQAFDLEFSQSFRKCNRRATKHRPVAIYLIQNSMHCGSAFHLGISYLMRHFRNPKPGRGGRLHSITVAYSRPYKETFIGNFFVLDCFRYRCQHRPPRCTTPIGPTEKICPESNRLIKIQILGIDRPGPGDYTNGCRAPHTSRWVACDGSILALVFGHCGGGSCP